MEIVRRARKIRSLVRKARESGLCVAFVPTMGALHEGHLDLVRAANERADVTVVSVFVNPTQFGPEEDFDSYPRDTARDVDKCITVGVDYLFVPEPEEIYPPGDTTFVEVAGISDRLEGASRPGHFRGVATVVTKLLNIVVPDVVVFGWKDAQQVAVVRRLVADLFLDVEVVAHETARDEDGLALSSRNAYLSSEERAAAAAIPRAIETVERRVSEGETDGEKLVEAARTVIEAEPLLRVDYIELVERTGFDPMKTLEKEALLVLAVHCGTTRLLDNVKLTPPTTD